MRIISTLPDRVRFGVFILLCALLFLAPVSVQADVTAEVIKPEGRAPGASKYIVVVRGLEITRTAARDTSLYDLRDASEKSVTITGVNPIATFAPKIQVIQIYGDINPNTNYKLKLKLGGAVVPLAVKELKEEVSDDEEKMPAIRYISDKAWFNFEPMVGENTRGLGANFEVGIDFGEFGDIGTSGQLTVEGEIASDSDDGDFSRTVKGGLTFEHFLQPFTMVSPIDGKNRKYPIGFRMSPAGFEADQEFDLIDYNAKAELAFGVPFTDIPGQMIKKAIGARRDFGPMFLLTGYTYVQDAKDDDTQRAFDVTHRWDTELAWLLPLSNKLDAELRYKSFLNLENGEHKDRFLAVLRYDIEKGRAITLSYKNGGDAPTFNNDTAFRVGFDIDLGAKKENPLSGQ